MWQYRLRLTGRVQGVGLRAWCRHWALQGGLAGRISNEPDGSVRLLLEGRRPALDNFVGRLRALHHPFGPDVEMAELEGEQHLAAPSAKGFVVLR